MRADPHPHPPSRPPSCRPASTRQTPCPPATGGNDAPQGGVEGRRRCRLPPRGAVATADAGPQDRACPRRPQRRRPPSPTGEPAAQPANCPPPPWAAGWRALTPAEATPVANVGIVGRSKPRPSWRAVHPTTALVGVLFHTHSRSAVARAVHGHSTLVPPPPNLASHSSSTRPSAQPAPPRGPRTAAVWSQRSTPATPRLSGTIRNVNMEAPVQAPR